jgi:hypothetical protein
MTCVRCRGLMVSIRMEDACGSTTQGYVAWRCLLCGDVVEPGIVANRRARHEPIRNTARPPGSLVATTPSSKRRKR